jgi:hypothetical protein
MERTNGCGKKHSQDMFETPRQIREFLFQQYLDSYVNPTGEPPDAPAFSHVSAFFGEVAKSLAALGDNVQLEMLCGELTQELTKMTDKSDLQRPAKFPQMYSRAYLSNIP